VTEIDKTRVMGLDVGDARIGVALSDQGRMLASPHSIIERSAGSPVAHVVELAGKNSVETVVLGLPKNMNGTIGDQARKVQYFAQQLTQMAPTLKLAFVDERMTTSLSHAMLRDAGARKKKRKQHVDALSASLILQSYLDMERNRAGRQ
jgi:putative holliday junction resolvase